MGEETKKLLHEGAEGLLADTSGGEGASAAFTNFRRGVVWAQSGKGASPADLLAEVPRKPEVVGSLITLFGAKKVLQRQVAYVLKLLIEVSVPWELAWHECSVPAETSEALGIPHGAEAAADAAVRADIASKDNKQQEEEVKAPAPVDAVVEDARALLKGGSAGLLADSVSEDDVGDAFGRFRRGVIRAESCTAVEPKIILEEVTSKPEIVSALLALLRKRRIYRKQISTCLQKLVEASPLWAEAWNQTSVLPDEHEMVGIPHKTCSSMDLQVEGEASPGSCISPEEKQLNLLRQGLAELESINFDPAAHRAPLAFRWLSSGMSAEGRGTVLDEFSRKDEALEFLLELHGLKRLYRQSIAHCIAELLKQQSWKRVIAVSAGLRQRLKEQLQMHLQAESQTEVTGKFKDSGAQLLRQVLVLETVVAPSVGEKLLKQASACSIGDDVLQQASSESLVDTGEEPVFGHGTAEMSKQDSMAEDLSKQPSPKSLAETGGCIQSFSAAGKGLKKESQAGTTVSGPSLEEKSKQTNSLADTGKELRTEPHLETSALGHGVVEIPSKPSSPTGLQVPTDNVKVKQAPATSGYSAGSTETCAIDIHVFTSGGDRLDGKALSQALKRYSPKSNTNPPFARSIVITKQKSIIVVESFDSFDFAKTVYDCHKDSKVLYASQGGVLVEMTSQAWSGLMGLGKDTKGVDLVRAFATSRVNALIDGSAPRREMVSPVQESAAAAVVEKSKGIEDDDDDDSTLCGLGRARAATGRLSEREAALEYVRGLAEKELKKLQRSGDVDARDLEATLDDYMTAYAEQVEEDISEEGHSWATYPRQHGLSLFSLQHFLRLRTFLSRHR